MTVVSLLSLKGAPGVTTLSCLLAAVWPEPGPIAVVEADPSGGDLAARFGLTSTIGWSSLSAAVRRSGEATRLDPHLQRLPGGLPVLVSGSGGPFDAASGPESEVVRSAFSPNGDAGLAVVDLGRVPVGADAAPGWLELSDLSILVVRDDPSAALHVRARAAELLDRTGGALGVLLVGGVAFRCRELAEFAGLPPLGDVPFDPSSAAVASGRSASGRRLAHSRLLVAMRRAARVAATRVAATRVANIDGAVAGADVVVAPDAAMPAAPGADLGDSPIASNRGRGRRVATEPLDAVGEMAG
jgi:hypothetical protein